MKKSGFTLVELFGTIIIIAIVSLITTPIIFGVIEKIRKDSVKLSVRGVFDAANLYYAHNSDKIIGESITFTCDGNKCATENNTKLNFKGTIPKSGQIIIKKSGQVEVYYLRFNNYCALGDKRTLDIQKECNKLDNTRSDMN